MQHIDDNFFTLCRKYWGTLRPGYVQKAYLSAQGLDDAGDLPGTIYLKIADKADQINDHLPYAARTIRNTLYTRVPMYASTFHRACRSLDAPLHSDGQGKTTMDAFVTDPMENSQSASVDVVAEEYEEGDVDAKFEKIVEISGLTKREEKVLRDVYYKRLTLGQSVSQRAAELGISIENYNKTLCGARRKARKHWDLLDE